MSKILITGGAGFIGSHVVRAFLSAGHQVVVVNTVHPDKVYDLDPRVQFYRLDVRQEELATVFATERPDVVFHLAAQIDIRRSVADPKFDNAVNVNGSINVFQLCCRFQVERVVFFSSGGVYGDIATPADERAPLSFTSPYILHKHTAEQHLWLLAKQFRLAANVLRLSNVYGPGQLVRQGEGAVIPIFLDRILRQQVCNVYGDGQQTRDFIYIDDVAAACQQLLTVNQSGSFNISSGTATSLNTLLAVMTEVLQHSPRVELQAERQGEVRHNVLDNSWAQQSLGWQPRVGLQHGLQQTLDWYRRFYSL